MAIQIRRGDYTNLDGDQMLPGEIAAVLSGDPNSQDGKSIYVCTGQGDIRRILEENDKKEIQNDIEEVTERTEKVENKVLGGRLSLPNILYDPGYILEGNPILLSEGDNLLKPEIEFFSAPSNGTYDPTSGLFTAVGNNTFGTWLHVPLLSGKTYYFHAKSDVDITLLIRIYGTDSPSSTAGTTLKQIYAGNSFSMLEIPEYQYYNISLVTVTTNLNPPFSAAVYLGEIQNEDATILSFDNLKSENYIGFMMLNSNGAVAKTEGLEDGISENMPSKTSILLTNRDSVLSKYEKPFSFRNTYSYLNNGEKSYFCWNHNMLRYDKALHRYIYICKNKSTHSSSGDENEYMYIIDPSNPFLSTPQKIYTIDGKQIRWCQGFAIMDDGTWILADCTIGEDALGTNGKMIKSTDHGSTFAVFADYNPPVPGAYLQDISMGFNNRIFGAYDQNFAGTSNTSYICYSDDLGENWTDIAIVGQKFVEQTIIPISDSRLALVARYDAYSSNEQMAVTAYSDDNGLTWTFFSSNLKMHANDCAGFMHNGLLELFCLERYYTNSFRVGDMTGQLTHYVGTADDFVNDKMIEYEVFYLTGYESADLGHPSACMDEYGGAIVITSANHERNKNETYPLLMYSDCNKNFMN